MQYQAFVIDYLSPPVCIDASYVQVAMHSGTTSPHKMAFEKARPVVSGTLVSMPDTCISARTAVPRQWTIQREQKVI